MPFINLPIDLIWAYFTPKLKINNKSKPNWVNKNNYFIVLVSSDMNVYIKLAFKCRTANTNDDAKWVLT